jgi:hypothetical protein
MTLSLLKDVPSLLVMSLAIVSTLISPAQAQTTCTSSSPECCWVVLSWQLMGKTTSVSSTSATDCCRYLGSTSQTSGILGVTCTSTGIVTEINWYDQGLQGPTPAELSNLVNLQRL